MGVGQVDVQQTLEQVPLSVQRLGVGMILVKNCANGAGLIVYLSGSGLAKLRKGSAGCENSESEEQVAHGLQRCGCLKLGN